MEATHCPGRGPQITADGGELALEKNLQKILSKTQGDL